MKIIFSLIVSTVILFPQTINEQIYALEKASPQRRVELMNNIKKQLISMNQEKRIETIARLQDKLQGNHKENSIYSQNTTNREYKQEHNDKHKIHERINHSEKYSNHNYK